MALKAAEVPFEDEKFSYVVLTRAPVVRPAARVLAQPAVGKVAVTSKLCTPDGVAISKIPRRLNHPRLHRVSDRRRARPG